MATYEIVRTYMNEEFGPEIVRTGLTLEEAQEHCNDPETSSRTCTTREGKDRTKRCGPWFDGYTEE